MNSIKETSHKTYCYHCGESCFTNNISVEEKFFCCEGCKTVYQILNESNLCEYYNLNDNPGISQRIKIRKDKFAFLDDEKSQEMAYLSLGVGLGEMNSRGAGFVNYRWL